MTTPQNKATILVVDDEAYIGEVVSRWLTGEGYAASVAKSAPEAVKMLQQAPADLVLCDIMMPKIDGLQLLARLRSEFPSIAVLMMTGVDDRNTAVQTVRAGAFGYMIKPLDENELLINVANALERRRLEVAERDLLEKTLNGAIRVLTEILSLTNPSAFGRAARVQRLARRLGELLNAGNLWELEMAAMLSQIGCVTVPPYIFDKVEANFALSPDEEKIVRAHPEVARNLLANIPRLERVANIVYYQSKGFDGSGFPADDAQGAQIPLAARILRVAIDYDRLESRDIQPYDALDVMSKRRDIYDQQVFSALETALGLTPRIVARTLPLRELDDGMILVDNIVTADGMLLASKGLVVTQSMLQRLESTARVQQIREPIKVLVPHRAPS